MPEKDMTEKTLEAWNDVFADIVNGLLYEGRQVVKEDALIDAQPVSIYKADGTVHEQERDVAKYWIRPDGTQANVRLALLGFENQTAYDADMVLRVFGYDGAAYRAELERKERYPVITLVLYFGDRPWIKNRTLYETLDIPESLKPYVNDYRLNLFSIADLPEESIDWFRSDFKAVAEFFIHRKKRETYQPKDPVKFEHVDEMLKLMKALTNDERLEVESYREGGKPDNMRDWYLDMFEKQGEERGIAKGEVKGRLKTLGDLVKNGILSLDVAAREAKLSPEEFEAKIAELAAEE